LAYKWGAYTIGTPCGTPLFGYARFLSNFKLGLKWLAVTNDPAANAAVLITTEKGFIVLARCY